MRRRLAGDRQPQVGGASPPPQSKNAVPRFSVPSDSNFFRAVVGYGLDDISGQACQSRFPVRKSCLGQGPFFCSRQFIVDFLGISDVSGPSASAGEPQDFFQGREEILSGSAEIPCPRRLPRKPVAETVGQTAPRGPGPLGAGLAAELARLEAVDPVPGLGRARGRHGAARAGRRRSRKQAPRKKPDPPLPPRDPAGPVVARNPFGSRRRPQPLPGCAAPGRLRAAAGVRRSRWFVGSRTRSCSSPSTGSGTRSRCSRTGSWSSTTSRGWGLAPWSATSTWGACRTCCPAWRRPSWTWGRAATPFCTRARSAMTRRWRELRPGSSRCYIPARP